MKIFTKISAAILAAAMILAVTSCEKPPEATEAVTEASEAETEETTTSETTAEETTAETTEETTEETEAVPAIEGDMFDLEEYPFDISIFKPRKPEIQHLPFKITETFVYLLFETLRLLTVYDHIFGTFARLCQDPFENAHAPVLFTTVRTFIVNGYV